MAEREFIDPVKARLAKEEKEEAERIEKRRTHDISKLLKQPEFRRFVWHILELTGTFNSSFTLNSMQTAFREGQRDIGIAVLQSIDKADANAVIQMRQEYVSEKKAKEAATKPKEEAS